MFIDCKTDRGKIREINEDYALTQNCSNYTILIVADGMGGHNAGEIASKAASDIILKFVTEKFNEYNEKEDLIRDSMLEANTEVYNESLKSTSLNGMGTTLTCGLIYNDNLYVGHVGDSRAYIINNSGIKRVTEDHSYVQELVNNGSITENEAQVHPQRNLITRAVGIEEYVVIDTKVVKLDDEDLVLLCTDGLTSCVTNDEIYNIVMKMGRKSIENLIELCNQRGGNDNITIIIAGKEEVK